MKLQVLVALFFVAVLITGCGSDSKTTNPNEPLPASSSFDEPLSVSSALSSALSSAPTSSALSSGVSSSSVYIPPAVKKIHLYNPWLDTSTAIPHFHGRETSNWASRESMGQSPDSCGWYSYQFKTRVPGGFRFNVGWETEKFFGPMGLGVESDFNVDALLIDHNDIYVYYDPYMKLGVLKTTKPGMATCGGPGLPVPVIPGAGAASTPFPHNSDGLSNPYGRGAIVTDFHFSQIQYFYDLWKTHFYEESGNLARVKFDNTAQTVSEGIAYGMLISVYMDNAHNNSKADFDKLWNYYKNYSDSHGLMDWKINGFGSVIQAGAASDADVDAAVALIMAHRQWGDAQYLTDALDLIEAIRLYEMNGSAGIIKPGPAWDIAKNPSYFSLVAFNLFAEVDVDNSALWSNALYRHLTVLEAAQNPSTGLVPNWTDSLGVAANPGTGYVGWQNFGFDAIRVPWRMSWDYLWYDDTRAQGVSAKICTWISGATAGDANLVRDSYTTAGTALTNYTAGPVYTGGFATSCMVSSARQQLINDFYKLMSSQTSGNNLNYYHTSLQVLYALLLTGNMPLL
jgi:endo-1,4-beta-D-glucanase Y